MPFCCNYSRTLLNERDIIINLVSGAHVYKIKETHIEKHIQLSE